MLASALGLILLAAGGGLTRRPVASLGGVALLVIAGGTIARLLLPPLPIG
jgi:hypothetical protein